MSAPSQSRHCNSPPPPGQGNLLAQAADCRLNKRSGSGCCQSQNWKYLVHDKRRYSTHWMFHGLMDIQRAATTRPKCLNVFALASVISIVLEIESCIVLPKENVPALCSAGTFSLGLFFSTPTIDVEPLYSLTHPVKYRKIGDRHYRKRQVNPC